MSVYTIYKSDSNFKNSSFVKTQRGGIGGIPGALKEFGESIGFSGEIKTMGSQHYFEHNGRTYYINGFAF